MQTNSSPAKLPFDVLLFDLGNTLLFFDGDWPEIVALSRGILVETLVRAGYRFDRSLFAEELTSRLKEYYTNRETEFIEYTTEIILRDLLKKHGYDNLPHAVIHEFLDSMYAVTQEHWIVEVDAIPTLKTLKEKGYRLGILSNAGYDRDVQTLVNRSGLQPYFEQIITSAAVGIRKPHPRIFRVAMDSFHANPFQVLMIGDTLGADILGAFNAGLASIWVRRRANTIDNRAHEHTIQADAIVETLSEIPGVLEMWQISA
jgi:HAD superfamily hydrolase (TIGR01662 family)